jgi:hypothetical protein
MIFVLSEFSVRLSNKCPSRRRRRDGGLRKAERIRDFGAAVIDNHARILARNEPEEVHGQQRCDVGDCHQVGHGVPLMAERTLPPRNSPARICKGATEVTAAQALGFALGQAQEIVARGSPINFASGGSKQPQQTKRFPDSRKDLAENLDLSDELRGCGFCHVRHCTLTASNQLTII